MNEHYICSYRTLNFSANKSFASQEAMLEFCERNHHLWVSFSLLKEGKNNGFGVIELDNID
jgi:hypothetical protein